MSFVLRGTPDRDRRISAQQRMFLDQREERDRNMEKEVQKLFPRSKRREVRHSTAGIFDFDSLEAETDSGSEDELEPDPKKSVLLGDHDLQSSFLG